MARVIPIGPIYAGGPCRGFVHVIQKGDTLYNLGKQYHVSVTQLMFANPFVDVYNLQIGDELCIPSRIQPRQGEGGQEPGLPSPPENMGNAWPERGMEPEVEPSAGSMEGELGERMGFEPEVEPFKGSMDGGLEGEI